MNTPPEFRERPPRRHFHFDGTSRIGDNVAEEMHFHLDSRIADLLREGLSLSEARARAESEFGDLQASQSELREIDQRIHMRRSRAEWFAGWQQDVALAVRGIRRRTGFSATVVATLALGIGATTAVFSLANVTLLQGLPYRDAASLVHVFDARTEDISQTSAASYPNLRDWRSSAHSFASLDAYNQTNLTLNVGGEVSRVRGVRVTPGLLATLGVRPALGRDLTASDEKQTDGPVAIVTDQFWRNQLGGRTDVVGQQIQMDGVAHTVIGVLPPDFHFAPAQDFAVWLPLTYNAQAFEARGFHWLSVVGRLKSGVSTEKARTELADVMRQLAIAYPESNEGRTTVVKSLREVIVGDVRPLVVLLLAGAGLVLLIACVNVAGLMLARSSARAQELAVRGALGASRLRTARTLLTETLVLSAVGGLLGSLLAVLGIRIMLAAVPEQLRLSLPTLQNAQIDATALTVTAVMTMACGIFAGLLPAIKAGSADIASLMRQGGRTLAGGTGRSRSALIVAEIALTMVLLVGTGLLGRSLINLMHLDFGFDGNRVLTARIALAGNRYQTPVQQQHFFEQLVSRVQDIPGIEVAGAVSNPPFNGGGSAQFRVEGEIEPVPANRPDALIRGVAGAYFESLRIPLIAGRAFLPTDDSSAAQAVVINASLARKLFGTSSPINRQIRFYGFGTKPWTIVGVVADVTTDALDQPAPNTIYMSHLQAQQNRMSLMLRSRNDPVTLAQQVRREVRVLDPELPVYGVETMEDRILRMPEVSSRRFPLILITVFSVSALLLAVVGVYGLVSQTVQHRMREFGIRRALGAGRGTVMALVVRQGVLLGVGGVVAGGVIASLLTQSMQSLLYGVPKTDLATYACVALLMLSVAVAACLVPARRAADIDPNLALRAED